MPSTPLAEPSGRAQLAAVLSAVDPAAKVSQATSFRLSGAAFPDAPPTDWPAPARRDEPPLCPPADVPRRRLGSLEGRQALLHAIAHIELNAIDLAADMAGRFAHHFPDEERAEFVADWVEVMQDEARHFTLLSDRLTALGSRYGAFPAHDGLFDAARATSDDLAARLAIAPMVLEARGLDVTPGMIDRLRAVGDEDSAAVLTIILEEEVHHVAKGVKWFRRLCERDGTEAGAAFGALVNAHFPAGLKRPFNDPARQDAGLLHDWYDGLAP